MLLFGAFLCWWTLFLKLGANRIDIRKFWKTVKPILSNKFVNNENITLVDNKKIITNDKEIAKVLNDFFSNIIKTLNIPKNDHTDSIVKDVRDPT